MGRGRKVVMVAGIDPSVSSTSLMGLPTNWGGDWSKLRREGGIGYRIPDGSLVQTRIQRCEDNTDDVLAVLAEWGCWSVVIEGYAHASKFFAHQTGEYGGILRTRLIKAGIRVRECPPSTGRALLLGDAPAKGQGAIKVRVQKTWRAAGFPHWKDHDDADAMTTLNYGLSEEGGLCF